MKANYISHDKTYQKVRAEGKQRGWDTEKLLQESIASLENPKMVKHFPESGKFLELGCGAGDTTLWFAQKGFDVSGVDISLTAIEWAKEKSVEQNIKAEFHVGNVLDMKNYPDNSFDFVLDGHCLHCIIGDDRKLFFAGALRVLKPKGFFFIRTMCGDTRSEDFKKYFDPITRCLVHNDIANRYLGLPDSILEEIRKAGFHILQWEVIQAKEDNPDDMDELLVALSK